MQTPDSNLVVVVAGALIGWSLVRSFKWLAKQKPIRHIEKSSRFFTRVAVRSTADPYLWEWNGYIEFPDDTYVSSEGSTATHAEALSAAREWVAEQSAAREGMVP